MEGKEIATKEQALTEFQNEPMVPVDERGEIAVTRTIEAAVILSKRFPRNEEKAYAGIMRACKRPSFAEDAVYAFPRGDKTVTGPSINLAREAARLWGNIRFGWDVVTLTDDTVKIRAWAWDMETNTYNSIEDEFARLVYRKKGGWVVPDERDLRELTNRRSAIAVRNCLLQLIPKDFVEDAMAQSSLTAKGKAEKDIGETIKGTIKAFQTLNVSVEELERYLGHDLKSATPDELVQLQQIGKAIKDGQATKAEFFTGHPQMVNEGRLNLEDMGIKDQAKAN